MLLRFLILLFMTSGVFAAPASADVIGQDFFVKTEDGLAIFVRRLADPSAAADLGPFLLVNGGRPGVLASWDVDAPRASTAALFAEAGHIVYLMDARGFGRSDFTTEMEDGAENGPVAVRSYEVVRDLRAVVEEIKRRHPNDSRLAAIGWATGSQWLGHYAALYPEEISRLIYYQGAYGGTPGGWAFQSVAGADNAALLDRERFPAFRCSTAKEVVARLAEEAANKAFLDRYVELAMEGDEKAGDRDPACFRFPSGPLADTLMMVNGRPVFDASTIAAHVLILRSENDFWSRPEDARALREHLTNAASVAYAELTGATHYVHLLPKARGQFVKAVLDFTKAESPNID